METAVPILAIVCVTIAASFYVIGRAWQRRHTYMEEFWHSNGW
jgi:hypothetical protein